MLPHPASNACLARQVPSLSSHGQHLPEIIGLPRRGNPTLENCSTAGRYRACMNWFWRPAPSCRATAVSAATRTGAAAGNRTRITSLAKKHSAVEPQPHKKLSQPDRYAGVFHAVSHGCPALEPAAGNTTPRTSARDERTNTVANNALAFAPAGVISRRSFGVSGTPPTKPSECK